MLTTNFVDQQALAFSPDHMRAIVRWWGSHNEQAVAVVEKSNSGWLDPNGEVHCWHKRMWATNVDRLMSIDWPRICAEPTYDERREAERRWAAQWCKDNMDDIELPFI